MSSEKPVKSFADLDFPAAIQKALNDVGYETPSAIQAETIPHLLAGSDLIGQAQTGTGKTAAFALPVLARLDLAQKKSPQVMVLAPTRELATQVAEALQTVGGILGKTVTGVRYPVALLTFLSSGSINLVISRVCTGR